MEIREASADEIRPVAELWMHTFPGERTVAERMAVLESGGIHGGIETVRVAVEGSRIAGALKTIPFTQYVRGARFRMMGLAAVGVAPFARRRGVAAALCREALVVARDRGDVLSVLYPFRPAFYRRLGWALAGELHSYRFAPEALRATGEPDVDLAGPSDLARVRDCYRIAAAASNGLIERDEAMWTLHLNSGDAFTFVTGGERVSGYMIVRYGTSRRADQRPLHVRELIALDGESYDRLVSWIPRQQDLWRRVRYDALPEEQFGHRLLDPRPPSYRSARWLWAETATILRGPMVRVLNVEKAIDQRREWGQVSPFAFTLTVEDRELPANAGPWRVESDGDRVRIEPGAGSRGDGSSAVRIDVGAFGQLFVGELDLWTAVGLGRARLDGDGTRIAELFGPVRGFRVLDQF
jgi:predicted acetyltransferase